MTRSTSFLCGAILLTSAAFGATTAAAPAAPRPEFAADAHDNSLMIYSTADKATKCSVRVIFSYQDGTGRREGTHSCVQRMTPVGAHQEYCGVTSPYLVSPKIEGPVTASCE